tara:strand:- start:1545 stop:2231 length:687 start_codon:yes stop_codon:yes gene_type:complete
MKKLIYLLLTVLIVGCSGEDGNNNNQSSCNGDNPVYLADNGVTVKACDDASVGDTGVINGITYTVVDEAVLREMVANEEDVTAVVTTKVTNMSELFFLGGGSNGTPILNDFNQNISSWDVSNVTSMGLMFLGANLFNQPIGNWDVSSVTNMSDMFYGIPSNPTSAFNQPIGNWNVSNVTNMGSMFSNAVSFNQDLSSWGVDNVTYCLFFSSSALSWTLPQPNFTNCTP